eukprot:TRINITY_DN2523_c0_g1_i1.p1 TRINITY_DN2523_c0_g1~~TRINITY_DN2523_c0_g1_i1.p1  ORF type:complete len:217 (+),score=25.43 TRINITY_DN2523_c0_g1_i1:65-715(+)
MQRVQLGFLAVFVLFALSSVFSVEDANYEYVTCHSVIKLAHQATGFRLHSHEVSYGNSGSGQQSVTGFPHNDDPNSLWLVKARHGQVCKNGERIKSGSVIRLEHVNTRKNLHSHNHRSPLSQSQEVSAYAPTKGEGDLGDNWVVDALDETFWKRGQSIRLRHVETRKFLSSNPQYRYQNPIPGQQEVVCGDQPNQMTVWRSEEGIYLPALDVTTHK